MTYVRTLQALIADKEAEIARLEAELDAARAYVRVLGERLSVADKIPGAENEDDPIVEMRHILIEAGRPLFIDDILRRLGRQVSRDSREQIRRLLLPWVRRREVFTRPRPSIYGLRELEGHL